MGGEDAAQGGLEAWRQVRAFKREGNIGREEADLVAAVVGGAFVFQPMEGLAGHQPDHRVGNLDFAARSRRLLFNLGKDFRLQNIAPGNDHVGRGILAAGFFHHLADGEGIALPVPGTNDAIAVNVRPRNFLDGDDIAAAAAVINIDHLLQAARLRMHDHVGEKQGKGRVAHQMPGAPYGVAQSQRFLLAGKTGLAGPGQVLFQHVQFSRFTARAQC